MRIVFMKTNKKENKDKDEGKKNKMKTFHTIKNKRFYVLFALNCTQFCCFRICSIHPHMFRSRLLCLRREKYFIFFFSHAEDGNSICDAALSFNWNLFPLDARTNKREQEKVSSKSFNKFDFSQFSRKYGTNRRPTEMTKCSFNNSVCLPFRYRFGESIAINTWRSFTILIWLAHSRLFTRWISVLLTFLFYIVLRSNLCTRRCTSKWLEKATKLTEWKCIYIELNENSQQQWRHSSVDSTSSSAIDFYRSFTIPLSPSVFRSHETRVDDDLRCIERCTHKHTKCSSHRFNCFSFCCCGRCCCC